MVLGWDYHREAHDQTVAQDVCQESESQLIHFGVIIVLANSEKVLSIVARIDRGLLKCGLRFFLVSLGLYS